MSPKTGKPRKPGGAHRAPKRAGTRAPKRGTAHAQEGERAKGERATHEARGRLPGQESAEAAAARGDGRAAEGGRATRRVARAARPAPPPPAPPPAERRRFVTTKVEVEGREEVKVVELPAFEPEPWGADAELAVVGRRVPRADALEKVTGRAR